MNEMIKRSIRQTPTPRSCPDAGTLHAERTLAREDLLLASAGPAEAKTLPRGELPQS